MIRGDGLEMDAFELQNLGKSIAAVGKTRGQQLNQQFRLMPLLTPWYSIVAKSIPSSTRRKF